MSICDEVTALAETVPQNLDKHICKEYESATELFEELIQQHLTAKRGCRLISMENRICRNAEINHSIKP